MKTRYILGAIAAFFALACVAFFAAPAFNLSPSFGPAAAAGVLCTAMAVGILALAVIIIRKTHHQGVASNAFYQGLVLHKGSRNYKIDAAITAGTFAFLVKLGSDANHVAVCGAGDVPIGVVYNDGGAAHAAEEWATVHFLGQGPIKVPASAAIAAGAKVYTAANGKVQGTPTAAGTYYYLGVANILSAADGDFMEVQSITPVLLKALVTFGNVNSEISALTSSANTTQAEFNALRDKLEELADDLRAVQTAASEPCLLLLGMAS